MDQFVSLATEAVEIICDQRDAVTILFAVFQRKLAKSPTFTKRVTKQAIDLYTKYKDDILDGVKKDDWLLENVIVLGSSKAQFKFSMIYYKLDIERGKQRVLRQQLFKAFLCLIPPSTALTAVINEMEVESAVTSSETSSDESTSSGEAARLSIARSMYTALNPEIQTIIKRMETPLPPGMTMTNEGTMKAQRELNGIKAGLAAFESAIL